MSEKGEEERTMESPNLYKRQGMHWNATIKAAVYVHVIATTHGSELPNSISSILIRTGRGKNQLISLSQRGFKKAREGM